MNSINNKKILKKTMVFCCLFFVFLLVSLFVPMAVYACLLIGVIAVVALPTDALFCFLLFGYPYANLLAIAPGGFSLFILLELLSIGILFLRGSFRSIHFPVLAGLGLLFLIIMFTVDALSDVKYYVLVLKIVLLLYIFVKNYKKNASRYYFTFFLTSIILSSIIGLFKLKIDRLLLFFKSDLNYEAIGNVYVMRFSGINPDPNHYSIPLILCITVCLLSIFSKQAKYVWIRIAAFLMLVLFGLMTLSKSFILIFLVTMFFSFIILAKRSRIRTLCIFIVMLMIGSLLIPKETVGNMLYRFMNITNTNVSTMNGREAIWNNYITEINSSSFSKWMGHGMQAALLNGRASHNIFIEMIYRCGILGMVVYIGTLISVILSNNKIKSRRGILSYWGFVVIIVQYCFLSGFTVYDYTYYLMIAYIIFVNSYKEGDVIF